MKLIIFTFLFLQISTYRCQLIDSDYLKSNSVILNNNHVEFCYQLGKIGLLDSNLKYYFIGEQHYNKGNEKIFLENYYWLNKFRNCELIVFEVSHKFEEEFNIYINTGADSIIQKLKSNYEASFSDEFSKILIGLYKYKTENNIQIQIKCIDIEKDLFNTFERLKFYTDSLKACNEIYEEINQLAAIGIKFYHEKSRIENILTQLSKIKEKISEIPECEEKKHYSQKIKGIFSAYCYKKNKEIDLKLREDYIYNNFKKLIEYNPNKVVLSKFGFFHTNLTNKFNYIQEECLVNRLIKYDYFANNICSIYSIYEKNQVLSEIYFKRKQIRLIKKFCGNNITLIKITNDKKANNYNSYFNYCIFLPKTF